MILVNKVTKWGKRNWALALIIFLIGSEIYEKGYKITKIGEGGY